MTWLGVIGTAGYFVTTAPKVGGGGGGVAGASDALQDEEPLL